MKKKLNAAAMVLCVIWLLGCLCCALADSIAYSNTVSLNDVTLIIAGDDDDFEEEDLDDPVDIEVSGDPEVEGEDEDSFGDDDDDDEFFDDDEIEIDDFDIAWNSLPDDMFFDDEEEEEINEVSFIFVGENGAQAAWETVERGSAVGRPEAPTEIDGKVFAGWYYEDGTPFRNGKEYDGEADEVLLFAKYTAVSEPAADEEPADDEEEEVTDTAALPEADTLDDDIEGFDGTDDDEIIVGEDTEEGDDAEDDGEEVTDGEDAEEGDDEIIVGDDAEDDGEEVTDGEDSEEGDEIVEGEDDDEDGEEVTDGEDSEEGDEIIVGEDDDEDGEEVTEGEDDDEDDEPAVERSVRIFSNRRSNMNPGESVTLSSELIGFEDCNHIYYQWQADRGNGFEDVPGANGASYTFIADPDTLSYDWRLIVETDD